MKLFFFCLLQWTWGLPQNLVGLALWLCCKGQTQPRFHGAMVKRWAFPGSAGIGMFLFLERDAGREILVHEYGHSIQSIILGPLFFFVIGLPSLLWAGLPLFRRYRQKRNRSYYWFYPERWANRLGAYAAGKHPEKEVILCSKTETKL